MLPEINVSAYTYLEHGDYMKTPEIEYTLGSDENDARVCMIGSSVHCRDPEIVNLTRNSEEISHFLNPVFGKFSALSFYYTNPAHATGAYRLG